MQTFFQQHLLISKQQLKKYQNISKEQTILFYVNLRSQIFLITKNLKEFQMGVRKFDLETFPSQIFFYTKSTDKKFQGILNGCPSPPVALQNSNKRRKQQVQFRVRKRYIKWRVKISTNSSF
eukprot:TRINITY_DN1507_c0_g1_i8.p2 TRINITY_DN1507_c0_g1~~TRINITY_DN1507_c0_g1_i8.p2  ORF type:complete len:122 (+),score=8.18 TRINITY_DN1507_c0_g1_i8:420-785(+)